jgi:DNA-binding GntR family transcriptional regulator
MSRASDQAYANIRSLILSGDAPPGTQLTETQLADICGVSRTPVRDALRRLEAELYIVRSDSQRVFVADWSREEVGEMFTLRGMLESHAAARAAVRMTPEMLAKLVECNASLTAAVVPAAPDVPTFLAENRRFHELIVSAAQSPRLATILASIVELSVIRRTAAQYGRAELARSAHDHDELIEAFAAHDSDWAAAVMAGHIRRAFHAFSTAK